MGTLGLSTLVVDGVVLRLVVLLCIGVSMACVLIRILVVSISGLVRSVAVLAVGVVALQRHLVMGLNLMHLMSVMLLSTDVVMLVCRLRLLTLRNRMLRGGLSAHRHDFRGLVTVGAVYLLRVIGLHLQNQGAILDVRLRSAEGSAVGIEGGVVALVPAVSIKGVEVVSPVEVEAASL